MSQSLIVLGGFQFPYNPYPYTNPPIKSTSYNATIGGGYNVTWLNAGSPHGTFVQDQEIKFGFSVIDLSFYNQLVLLFETVGSLTFIDPYSVSWTVKFNYLTPKSLLKGGDSALEDVEVILRVVSQP